MEGAVRDQTSTDGEPMTRVIRTAIFPVAVFTAVSWLPACSGGDENPSQLARPDRDAGSDRGSTADTSTADAAGAAGGTGGASGAGGGGSGGGGAGGGGAGGSAGSSDGSVMDRGSNTRTLCATIPSVPTERPTEANTGPARGTKFQIHEGDWTIREDGAIVDSVEIHGTLSIEANDVTVINTRVHFSDYGLHGIKVAGGKLRTKILYSEIYSDDRGYIGVLAQDTTVCGCNIHNFENGITMTANMVVQGNYIHGIKGNEGSHHDGIEGGNADNTIVYGNNLLLTWPDGTWHDETAALNFGAFDSDVDGADIRGNWFGGGTYSLYVREANGHHYSNVHVVDNTWIKNSAQYGPVSKDSDVTEWSGNRWDDGTAIEQ